MQTQPEPQTRASATCTARSSCRSSDGPRKRCKASSRLSGGSLVSKSCQIYKKGAPLDHIECGNATRRLAEVTSDVKNSLKDLEHLGEPSSDAKALEIICRNCVELSEELILWLESVRLDEKNTSRKWKSFRQALKTVCMKDGVGSLARRIANCRDELNTHLIVSTRKKADTLLLRQMDFMSLLNDKTSQIIETLLETRTMIKEDLLRRDTPCTSTRRLSLKQIRRMAQSGYPKAIRPNFWSSIRLPRLWHSSLSGSHQDNAHSQRKPIHHLHPKSSNSSRFKAS